MSKAEDYARRVVSRAEVKVLIVQFEDGHWYFFPGPDGAFSAYGLKAIADELLRRNEEYERRVKEDLDPSP